MMKFIFITIFFIMLAGCNENPVCKAEALSEKSEEVASASCPAPIPEPIPEPIPGPGQHVPNEALTFDASVELFKFEADDEAKLFKAIEIIKAVVATDEFRDRVLNFTFNGKKQFLDNKGMTNEQIYQALLDGREDLKPEVDNEMDLQLELYYSFQNTVGYTTPGQLKIFMNTKFFNPYTPSEVAGNVFHEWTHKLGFTHASSYSVQRDSSVPYAIGYIIKELGKKYE